MPLTLGDYLQPEPAKGWPKLSPEDERLFQAWYQAQVAALGMAPDPDDPLHQYDWRGAYQAGATTTPDPTDQGRPHWTSIFKGAQHPNRFVNGIDTTTGQPATLEEMLGDTELRRRWR